MNAKNNKDINNSMLVNIRHVNNRLARKPHVCSFSGRAIKPGDLYYEISYLQGEDHLTYRVHRDEVAQFIKEKIWMELGKDFRSMTNSLSKAVENPRDQSLVTEHIDIPGFEAKLGRLIKRAKEAIQNLRN